MSAISSPLGRISLVAFFVCLFAFAPLPFRLSSSVAHASSEVTATPLLIDEKAKQRDILKYTVTIENTSKQLQSVYPWVTDIDPDATALPAADLGGAHAGEMSHSLARWIQVTRAAIDLLPGDKRDVPIMVEVNVNAPPGRYHAVIHFSPGTNRVDAEKNITQSSSVIMNIEVLDDAHERLELGTFAPEKTFFQSSDASFNYRISNIGNRGVVPQGLIRIFDRNGEEVGSIPANAKGEKIEPNAKTQLAGVWASSGRIGRYKAMLDISYGERGTLQDSVFFWILPWGQIISYFMGLATLIVILSLFAHSYFSSRRRLAPAMSYRTPQREEHVPEEELCEEDESGGAEGLIERLRALIPWQRGEESFDGPDTEPAATFSSNVLASTLVRIPPPTRTFSRSPVVPASIPERKVSERRGTRHISAVTLSKKPEPKIDPAHVVTLRRRGK